MPTRQKFVSNFVLLKIREQGICTVRNNLGAGSVFLHAYKSMGLIDNYSFQPYKT